ncbi:MAG: hypothetical protein GOV00_04435 [Candidatus Altiarchaeota archaeon]|nr:hypothetical protein [Candidatus Altiarchaeota archaeon]
MNTLKLLLLGSLLMVAGFSFSYDIYVDGSPVGEEFEISQGTHTAKLELVSENLTILNYSFTIQPQNLERILLKMNVPLTDTLDAVMPSQYISHTGEINIPDVICGTYAVLGEAYYLENGVTGKELIGKSIRIPCETTKAKFLYFAVSRLPWFVVNFFVDRFISP